MRPEDLGIAPFSPDPGPPKPGAPSRPATKTSPETVAVVAAAENVRVKIHALAETADVIERQYTALQGAYDRSQASGQRLSVETFHLKTALAEAKRHRLVLFVAGAVLLAIALLC